MGSDTPRQRMGGKREAWGLGCWVREEGSEAASMVLRTPSKVTAILSSTNQGPLLVNPPEAKKRAKESPC